MPKKENEDPMVQFKAELKAELEHAQKALSEISLVLEQSQLELGKQTQRHAAITGQLQQVQGQMDSLPRSDIQSVYTGALDAQQRLLRSTWK